MYQTIAISVVSALVSLRLDYANSVLFGYLQKQLVFNTYSRHSLES